MASARVGTKPLLRAWPARRSLLRLAPIQLSLDLQATPPRAQLWELLRLCRHHGGVASLSNGCPLGTGPCARAEALSQAKEGRWRRGPGLGLWAEARAGTRVPIATPQGQGPVVLGSPSSPGLAYSCCVVSGVGAQQHSSPGMAAPGRATG